MISSFYEMLTVKRKHVFIVPTVFKLSFMSHSRILRDGTRNLQERERVIIFTKSFEQFTTKKLYSVQNRVREQNFGHI